MKAILKISLYFILCLLQNKSKMFIQKSVSVELENSSPSLYSILFNTVCERKGSGFAYTLIFW